MKTMSAPIFPVASTASRTRLTWEVVIVLCLSLGASAIYSTLSFIRIQLSTTPIGEQTAQLNPSRDDHAVWDVVYGLLDVFFDLAIVALVIYLLWEPGQSAFRKIGLDFSRIGSDFLRALAIGLAIGVPGLGLYVIGRATGASIAIQASDHVAWYLVPVLLLSAARAGLLEEVILLGYLGDRLRRLGWGTWTIILSAAALRGLYHAYQGVPGIVGNFVMGIVFGWAYQRWGRVMPLVIAHTLIDIVAFFGYPIAVALFPTLFTA